MIISESQIRKLINLKLTKYILKENNSGKNQEQLLNKTNFTAKFNEIFFNFSDADVLAEYEIPITQEKFNSENIKNKNFFIKKDTYDKYDDSKKAILKSFFREKIEIIFNLFDSPNNTNLTVEDIYKKFNYLGLYLNNSNNKFIAYKNNIYVISNSYIKNDILEIINKLKGVGYFFDDNYIKFLKAIFQLENYGEQELDNLVIMLDTTKFIQQKAQVTQQQAQQRAQQQAQQQVQQRVQQRVQQQVQQQEQQTISALSNFIVPSLPRGYYQLADILTDSTKLQQLKARGKGFVNAKQSDFDNIANLFKKVLGTNPAKTLINSFTAQGKSSPVMLKVGQTINFGNLKLDSTELGEYANQFGNNITIKQMFDLRAKKKGQQNTQKLKTLFNDLGIKDNAKKDDIITSLKEKGIDLSTVKKSDELFKKLKQSKSNQPIEEELGLVSGATKNVDKIFNDFKDDFRKNVKETLNSLNLTADQKRNEINKYYNDINDGLSDNDINAAERSHLKDKLGEIAKEEVEKNKVDLKGGLK